MLLWIGIGHVDATGILIFSVERSLSTSFDLWVFGGLELCHSWFLAYIQFPARKVEPWLYLRIDLGCYESGHHSGSPNVRDSMGLVPLNAEI